MKWGISAKESLNLLLLPTYILWSGRRLVHLALPYQQLSSFPDKGTTTFAFD